MQFNDSGSYIIGITNESIDLFDNPYIRIAAYKLTEKFELKEEVKLRKCDKSDLLKLMPEELIYYYPNSLCIEKRIPMVGNWL